MLTGDKFKMKHNKRHLDEIRQVTNNDMVSRQGKNSAAQTKQLLSMMY